MGVVVRHLPPTVVGAAVGLQVITHKGDLRVVDGKYDVRAPRHVKGSYTGGRLQHVFDGKSPVSSPMARSALATFNADVRPTLPSFLFGPLPAPAEPPHLDGLGSDYGEGAAGSEHDEACLAAVRNVSPRRTRRAANTRAAPAPATGRYPPPPQPPFPATGPPPAPTPRPGPLTLGFQQRWWHQGGGPGK
jgi:hypothetical protein